MRTVIRLTLLASALIVLASCGGRKGADLQEGAVAPDKTLFENGMKFLGKKHFIKSRLSFQTLISTYPESEYTPTSFLSIADSYYEEGGKENLLQAEAQYKDFIIFYPTHESADNAQMRIAAINYRLMKPHDRDPTYTRKAEIELKKFLDDFPDSELAPTAEEFLRQVREELAKGVHTVGAFYFDRKRYSAAANRFEEVVDEYNEFSRLDESLFYLADSLENLGRVEEATVYYSRVAREYEFSPYFDNAREKLILLERPVPQLDKAKAARNLARMKRYEKEGFSILSPVRGVLGIFTGREDPYEVARRRAEQRQMEESGGDESLR
ncbi:MAG: outer membrane protein assembly factor BamD [Acidobacteriota bacterium]|nr:outer membrane protein assembly factor BamD [Acidobacteriota bacterium]